MNEWSKPNNEEINCKQFCYKASIFGFCVVHCDCEPFMSFKYSSLDVYYKQITACLVRLYDFHYNIYALVVKDAKLTRSFHS